VTDSFAGGFSSAASDLSKAGESMTWPHATVGDMIARVATIVIA
jgi:hypothetical protein